jgi:hypothetical protein
MVVRVDNTFALHSRRNRKSRRSRRSCPVVVERYNCPLEEEVEGVEYRLNLKEEVAGAPTLSLVHTLLTRRNSKLLPTQ